MNISRCHSRHAIFSSRRPSCRDSLHFVKTDSGKTSVAGGGQKGTGGQRDRASEERGGLNAKLTVPQAAEVLVASHLGESVGVDGQDLVRESRRHSVRGLRER